MNEMITTREETAKLQVQLYTRGKGIILFAVWTFLKTFFDVYTDSIPDILKSEKFVELASHPAAMFIVIMVIGALLAGFLIYVGRCAMSFGRGGKFHPFSLFLAGSFAAFSLVSDLSYVLKIFISSPSPLLFSELVVDLTVIILIAEIIIFSCTLKRRKT